MKPEASSRFHGRRPFLWVLLATAGILLIPLVAMQLTADINWTVSDFIIMGIMLMTAGSLFVIASRHAPSRYLWWIAAAIGLLFVYVWAELAVGIFTQLGS